MKLYNTLTKQKEEFAVAKPNVWAKIRGAFKTAMDKFSQAPIYIDDTAGVTITDLRAKCRRLASSESGLGLIIIDYLQLIEGGEDPYQRFKDVEKFLMMLKS